MPVDVKITEKDFSLYANSNNVAPVYAIVGTATKGVLNTPTLCVSQKDFKEKFGTLNPKCFGTYAAQHFLYQSSRIYYLRVAGESAKAASVTIPGTNTSSQTLDNALILEASEVGTFYDGYAVVISNVKSGTFDLGIKTGSSGSLVYKFEGLTLNDSSDKYIGKVLNDKIIKLKTITAVEATLTEGTYILSGGNNGESDEGLNSLIVSALDLLRSDNYVLDLMAVPGVSDASVINAALSVCESRGDTLFLVDPPESLTYEEVSDWHNGTGSFDDHTAFNSSFGALYWSWQYVYDQVNNMEVLVPPSVVVAPTIARSENMSKPWFAPAGLTRGVIKNALRSETVPDTEIRNILYDKPNNINCIITHANSGLCVFGQKTLWRQTSALDRINVRRLMTYIKRVVRNVCQYLIFEPNDRTTWNRFEDLILPTLRSLRTSRGLYDYKIIKGEVIVTDDDIDNYRMPAQVLIKPTKAAEYIPIDLVITSTGVEFNEITSAYNEV